MGIKISNYNAELNSILTESCPTGDRTTRALGSHVTVMGKYLRRFHLSQILNNELELTRHAKAGGPLRQRKHPVPGWD